MTLGTMHATEHYTLMMIMPRKMGENRYGREYAFQRNKMERDVNKMKKSVQKAM